MRRSLFLAVFTVLPAFLAQTQEPEFERLSLEAGLSQATVYTIFQDSPGFIWFGTQNGLNKYNGYKFTVFKHSERDSASLVDNNIRVIYEDRKRKLWIGTLGGLSRFDPVTETFVSFRHIRGDSTTLSNNRVLSITEDRIGRLWIGTEQGLNLFDRATGRFRRFLSSAIAIRDMYAAQDSTLWLATLRNGLIHFNPETGTVTDFKSQPGNADRLSSNVVMCLYADPRRKNQLWIGTYGGGLNRLDLATHAVTYYRHKPDDHHSLSDDRIFDICGDSAGRLWLGTFAGGLNRFDPETGKFTAFRNDPRKPKSLSSDFVRCVDVDKTGNLWVGTNLGGLNKIDIKPEKFTRYVHEPDDSGSLRHNYVNAVFESREGTLWVGTNWGVDVLPAGERTFRHLSLASGDTPRNRVFVSSVWAESDRNAWIGTFGDGLFEYDLRTGVKRHFTHDPHTADRLADNRIRDLYYDGDGKLWIATVAGANALDLQNGNVLTFRHDDRDLNSLTHNSVQFIQGDSRGNIWIGTNTGGLNRLNSRSGQIVHFLHDPQAPRSLSHNTVNTLYEAEDGNLWVGTDYGFSQLHWQAPDGEQFTHYFESDGLLNNHVCAVQEDRVGNLWISTTGGISRFTPKLPPGKQFRNYDWSDGLYGQSFLADAAFNSDSGEMFFGGTNGLVRFYPYQVRDNPYSPNVVFTAFSIFEQPTRLDTAISEISLIELSHKQNFFSLEFAALDFTRPQKNRYAYKLEGINHEWVLAGTRRYASYSNLDPGTYRFRVKGSNNDGIWNEEGASLTIVVKPPLWRTWWANAFYIIFGLVLVLGFRKYELNKRRKLEAERLRREKEEARVREARLRAQAAELQTRAIETEQELQKHKMRTLIATDLHDEIGSNLSSIALTSELLEKRANDSDLRRYLTDIRRAARTSTSAIRDIIWVINPMSDHVGELVIRLKETAGALLGQVRYEFAGPGRNGRKKLSPEIKRNVYLIYKEVLHNILKHARAESVRIEIDCQKNKLTLMVADDGVGFDESREHTGNGLRNLRSRAQEIGAQLHVQSAPGKGTRVVLVTKMA